MNVSYFLQENVDEGQDEDVTRVEESISDDTQGEKQMVRNCLLLLGEIIKWYKTRHEHCFRA